MALQTGVVDPSGSPGDHLHGGRFDHHMGTRVRGCSSTRFLRCSGYPSCWVSPLVGFEMFIQRVPLIFSAAACFVSHFTWYDVPVYLRVGLVCWFLRFDLFLWDLLYTKWL